ncbi:MAG: penicillin acylase family protein [Persicimonas sp.]
MPGGQSALTDSPHFDDQAALWLGNDTLPMRFSVEQVVEGATGREVLAPE